MGGVVQLVRDIIRGEADPLATTIVGVVVLLIAFLLFCVRFIREGEQAAILRFGRFLRIVGPGFVIIGPPWRSLQRIHIRQTSLRLPPQSVLVQDGVVFTVVGVLVFKITDAYKALFDIADLQEGLRDVGAGKLREVVSTRTSNEMSDIGALRGLVMEKLRDQEQQWGVTVIDFLLVNVEPSPAAQQLFLLQELARRRIDAAEVTLQGFRRLAEEIGLPPKSDSPLWAALAGMSVTVAAFGEPSAAKTDADERELEVTKLREEAKMLKERVESIEAD